MVAVQGHREGTHSKQLGGSCSTPMLFGLGHCINDWELDLIFFSFYGVFHTASVFFLSLDLYILHTCSLIFHATCTAYGSGFFHPISLGEAIFLITPFLLENIFGHVKQSICMWWLVDNFHGNCLRWWDWYVHRCIAWKRLSFSSLLSLQSDFT